MTFLLTDIEGSTALWERAGDTFQRALARHHALLRREFRRQSGCEVKELGDGFLVAFAGASDALACAVAAQQDLAAEAWPEGVGAIRVCMALHTGDVEREKGDYHGLVLHHASRMLAAAHGGQILCSEITASLLQRGAVEVLERRVRLSDLGVYRLRGAAEPERLFQVGCPGMAPRVFLPLNAEPGYTANLPMQFTRFFGREAEIARLREMLVNEQRRLVTLTGPGGSGKTRLALEVASRLVAAFHGAVWFVPLADLSDPGLIVNSVRDVLCLSRSPQDEPLEQVVAALSRQSRLLVMDNFEHLVTEGARTVRTLLERVPHLTCLVTSRQRLNLAGEHEFLVHSLPTPDRVDSPEQLVGCESVQLFVDRAQAVRSDFQVTRANASALAALCNRLEGIPLALELAAARTQVLMPVQMLAQLEHRFDFLVSRQRRVKRTSRGRNRRRGWSDSRGSTTTCG